MPESNSDEITQGSAPEFSNAWKRFIAALRGLLGGVPAERYLDAFVALRDAALDAAERDDVVQEMQSAWSALHARESQDVAHLLLTELQGFPVAVEISDAEEKANTAKPSSKRKLLGIGGTAIDSVRDILDNLPPLAKSTLTVVKEVIDIIRGE